MDIIDFEPEHLQYMTPQAAQIRFADNIDSVDAMLLKRPGLSFTGVAPGGRILGCAGVVPLWPGVAQAWAVLSDAALGEPVSLTRAVDRELRGIAESLCLRRIQATVAENHHDGARWLAFLGFEIEGLLVNYGPHGVGDYWMYGKVLP